VRDAAVRARAIEEATAEVREGGFVVLGNVDCVLPGPKGNVEAFVLARRA
jgi:predicted rRNA methylase YqxC with S4 and FtsJ domains